MADRPVWPRQGACCPVPSCRTDTFFTKYNDFVKHWSNRHIYMRTVFVCVTCKKVLTRKYDAKRHNSSAGKAHVCLEERAVNPTYRDPGNARKFVYPDLQERQRRSEEDQRQADQERRNREEEELRRVQEREERKERDRQERQARAQNEILDNWYDRNVELDYLDD